MTIGENIRRIRQERHLTQKQLGEMVGASEAYIRAYESGRRNPKPSSLEKIAEALAVNPEVLANSDFDGVKAMHRLFQVFRQYNGELFEYKDKDGNDMVGIGFGTLALMQSWLERYEKYMNDRKAVTVENNRRIEKKFAECEKWVADNLINCGCVFTNNSELLQKQSFMIWIDNGISISHKIYKLSECGITPLVLLPYPVRI